MAHIVLANIDIEYEEFGDKGKPVIILIMGLGGQLLWWDQEFCQALADEGFRVIRFDNRDVGMSKIFDEIETPNFQLFALLNRFLHYTLPAPYSLLDMANDVIELMDGLKIENAHIVGMSMGGMIGQLLAIHYPSRVNSLTAIMTSSLNPKLPKPELKMFWKLFKAFSKMPKSIEEAKNNSLEFMRAIAGTQYPLMTSRLQFYMSA